MRFINHDFTMGKGNMTPRTLIHTALLVALIAIIGLAATGRTPAAEPPTLVIQPKTIPPCDKPEALGLSRIVEIDTTGGPGFGFEHFKQYDFLRDKEVVLTFDDGPWPGKRSQLPRRPNPQPQRRSIHWTPTGDGWASRSASHPTIPEETRSREN